MLRWLGVGVVALLAAALGVGSKYAKRELPLFPIGTYSRRERRPAGGPVDPS